MNNPQLKFSEVVSAQFRRLRQWMKPNKEDSIAVRIIKTILKSLVILVLLMFSPVLLIGLALVFIGLM